MSITEVIDYVEDISNHIKDHLDRQPYSIKCSECGEDLTVAYSKLDHDFDLFLDIDPCNCVKEI